MKSAYELAMERLNQKSPSVKLSDDQKRQLAETDSVFRARIAEREIFLNGEKAKAAEQGDFEALAQLDRQLSTERRALEAECEEKKEAIRRGSGSAS